MSARKRLLQAGLSGAGAAYRHNVDPDYKGDTAIHRGMSKVPDEAWLGLSGGSILWKIMGDDKRKAVKAAAKKAGMKPTEYLSKRMPTEYLSKRMPTAMKRSLIKHFATPKALAKKSARTLGTAATGIGAPLALGFFAKDIYDVGSDFWDSITNVPETFSKAHQKALKNKRGGQVKKTKRKVRSKARGKPRGVGKALRGYGAVSR